MKKSGTDAKLNSTTSVEPFAVDLITAAKMCGYSVKTLRRAIQDGDLPAIRATAKIVIDVLDLRA